MVRLMRLEKGTAATRRLTSALLVDPASQVVWDEPPLDLRGQ